MEHEQIMVDVNNYQKPVGNLPQIQVSTVVFILDRQGNLLMGNRVEDDLWSLPGSILEPGESLENSARSGVERDMGLKVDEMVLLNTFSGPGFQSQLDDKGEVHHVVAAYLARSVSGKIVLNENRLRELRFFAAWNLRIQVNPLDQPVLLYFIQRFPGGQAQASEDLPLIRPKNFWENSTK